MHDCAKAYLMFYMRTLPGIWPVRLHFIYRVVHCSKAVLCLVSEDAEEDVPAKDQPTLALLQTNMMNPTTPNNQEEAQTRSVRFNGQDEQEDDSDSAMEESPVSDRNESLIEIHLQPAEPIAEPEASYVSEASNPPNEVPD